MKKIFKIILINILGITAVFLAAELYLFTIKFVNLYKEQNSNSVIEKIKNTLGYISPVYYRQPLNDYINEYSPDFFRPVFGKEYKNKVIAIFGCSFAYGASLKDEETIGALLSKYTKSTVYNFGMCAGSPKEILYLLRDGTILNSRIQKRNVDYVVYVYINDHKNRLFYEKRMQTPVFTYDKKTNSLKYRKYLTELNLQTIFIFRQYYANKIVNREKLDKKFLIYISEINKEIKKYFSYQKTLPKFIILDFYGNDFDNVIEDILKQGITIIKAKDLVKDIDDDKYKLLNDYPHPNAKTWEVLVPKFADAIKF